MKYANISIEKGYVRSDSRQGTAAMRKINIGDYAQILAIDYLYKKMGISKEELIYIEYYDLFDYNGEYIILPINFIFFNAYYGERDLILSPKIIPVFLGIHSINGNYNERELNYFTKYSPIGCRDMQTLCIFREKQIDAYLQGCVTLTFPQRELQKPAYKEIYFVDVPKSLDPYIPSEIKSKAIHFSQEIYGDIDLWLKDERCHSIKEYMEKRLKMYMHTASLIVTSRLHCAIPCVAMGIPTIFVCEEYSSAYAWMTKLLPIYTPDIFMDIDWNPGIIEYEPLKQKILNNAVNRIQDAYNSHLGRCEISEFFENNFIDEYKNSYTWRLEKYGKSHWTPDKKFHYMVWGITQITDEICSYMEKTYPNAILYGIIDDYRHIHYRGLDSIKSDKIPAYPDCYFIATGNSSSSAAQKKFAELGWDDKLCTVFGTSYVDSACRS